MKLVLTYYYDCESTWVYVWTTQLQLSTVSIIIILTSLVFTVDNRVMGPWHTDNDNYTCVLSQSL